MLIEVLCEMSPNVSISMLNGKVSAKKGILSVRINPRSLSGPSASFTLFRSAFLGASAMSHCPNKRQRTENSCSLKQLSLYIFLQ